MKLKNIFILISGTLLLVSCQDKESSRGKTPNGELSFSATVGDHVMSKGVGNDFFDEGYGVDVTIVSRSTGPGGETFDYIYTNDGIFTGDPGYRFTMDDDYIKTLTAIWPKDSIRQQGIPTDQRELYEFRKADWLVAEASANGIMPTDVPVPLNFFRHNSLIEFQVAGQSTAGYDIESLVIELQLEGDRPTAFWAYCGAESGNAQLILEQGTVLESSDKEMIGRMTIGNETYTVIFPETKLEIKGGYRYLVTMVPIGFDVSAYVYIGYWSDRQENGIGIPFQQPDPNPDGSFTISNGPQLIAMSYLLRHYYENTFDWAGRTYIIADDFNMTADQAALYVKIPSDMYNLEIVQNGVNITILNYGAGQTLELYE